MKFKHIVIQPFVTVFSKLMDSAKYSEEDHLAIARYFKKVKAESELFLERYKKFQEEFKEDAEKMKEKEAELLECDIELQPGLEYSVVSKEALTLREKIILSPILLNVPEDLKGLE